MKQDSLQRGSGAGPVCPVGVSPLDAALSGALPLVEAGHRACRPGPPVDEASHYSAPYFCI